MLWRSCEKIAVNKIEILYLPQVVQTSTVESLSKFSFSSDQVQFHVLGAPWLSPLLSSLPRLGDGLNYKSSVRAPSVVRSAEPFANLVISVKHGESFESAIAVPEDAKNGIFWAKRIPLNRSSSCSIESFEVKFLRV